MPILPEATRLALINKVREGALEARRKREEAALLDLRKMWSKIWVRMSSDTIWLGNLRRALHDLKVVGCTNTLHSEYDQEPNNTNNIVGDFNNSHENIRKYCEDNDV